VKDFLNNWVLPVVIGAVVGVLFYFYTR